MDLETVKEHFKNAKEVRCLADGNVFEIDINIEGIEQASPKSFWVTSKDKEHVKLYSSSSGFANIVLYKDISENVNNTEPKIILEGDILTPEHYNNKNGTLYKVAAERNWNPYLFDIVKRLERADKKGEFESDLNKSIAVIQLWLKESKNDN
jgi:hypothetical protein